MNIYVKQVSQPIWDDGQVSVVVDGFCNHANYEEEAAEFEAAEYDPASEGYTPTGTIQENILVCRRCHAWRYADEYPVRWHDEVILDDEDITTETR